MTEKSIKFKITEDSSKPALILGIKDGKLFVEGNLDENAKVFFETIIKPMADRYIEEQLARKAKNVKL